MSVSTSSVNANGYDSSLYPIHEVAPPIEQLRERTLMLDTNEQARVEAPRVPQDLHPVRDGRGNQNRSQQDVDKDVKEYDFYSDQKALDSFACHFKYIQENRVARYAIVKDSAKGALIGGAVGGFAAGLLDLTGFLFIPLPVGVAVGAVSGGAIGASKYIVTLQKDPAFFEWKRQAIIDKVYHHFKAFVESSDTLRDLCCPISFTLIEEPVRSKACGKPHVFEKFCLLEHLKKDASCPVCRVAMTASSLRSYPKYTYLVAKALDAQLPDCESKPHIHKGVVSFLISVQAWSTTKEISKIKSLDAARESGVLTEADYLIGLRKVLKYQLKLKNLKNFLDRQDVQKKKNVVITAILHNVSEQAEGNLI